MTSICIRVDASVQIGIGHVMRCLTLADELRQRGATACFVCRPLAGNPTALLLRHGHRVSWMTETGVVDGSACSVPAAVTAGFSAEHDADAMADWLARRPRCDWLVVDHYGVDCRWEARVRPLVGALMVIDDLADRSHACDLVLDQNLSDDPGRYAGLVPAECVRLLGPRYALLRPQFRSARGHLPPRDGTVKRLLVSFGGHDAAGATQKALDALDLLDWPVPAVDVVVGTASPHRASVGTRCAARPSATCHLDVQDMAALAASADLALGAGGITTWERCTLGLPSIVTAVADNQLRSIREGARAGFLLDAGPCAELTPAELARLVDALLREPARLHSMGEAAGRVCDGLGALRVTEHLATGPGRHAATLLRPADAADMEQYYTWANDPDVRANSYQNDTIPLEAHRRWFFERLADPASHMYVLERDSAAVGQIRFEVDAHGARVGFSVDQRHRGQGLATALLRAGAARLRADVPHVPRAYGFVKKTNAASLSAFRRAGFVEWTNGATPPSDSQAFVLEVEEP